MTASVLRWLVVMRRMFSPRRSVGVCCGGGASDDSLCAAVLGCHAAEALPSPLGWCVFGGPAVTLAGVRQNPQILHPVAVKGTREEQDRLRSDSDSDTASPERPAPVPAALLSSRHPARAVLRQSKGSHSAHSRGQPDQGQGG